MLTKSRTRQSSVSASALVLCINNKGYEVSLEPAKFYRMLPDSDAASHEQLRIVDESGEDFLYPVAYFARVPLSDSIRKAVLAAV
jgi:hypothetical protein